MAVVRYETRAVGTNEDVVVVRQLVREWAVAAGFSLVDQTKLVTAASELARNLVQYGGGGTCRVEALNDGNKRGLRLVFEGSANLRTNKNVEQVTAINDPGLHDWHAAWIDQKVREHEIDQSGSRATG